MKEALTAELPGFYRGSEWKRVYGMETDGRSLLTFFNAAQEYQATMLAIKDSDGYVFGAFCVEAWECLYRFFGSGETFLYTFKDTETSQTWGWTGDSSRH